MGESVSCSRVAGKSCVRTTSEGKFQSLKIKPRRPVVLIIHAFDPDAAAAADLEVLIALVVNAPYRL